VLGLVLAYIIFLVLVPLAAAGLALINAGRTRNAVPSMMAALGVIAVAALMWFVSGCALQGYAGGLAHAVIAGERTGTGSERSLGSSAVWLWVVCRWVVCRWSRWRRLLRLYFCSRRLERWPRGWPA
jgi:hypothetical protein